MQVPTYICKLMPITQPTLWHSCSPFINHGNDLSDLSYLCTYGPSVWESPPFPSPQPHQMYDPVHPHCPCLVEMNPSPARTPALCLPYSPLQSCVLWYILSPQPKSSFQTPNRSCFPRLSSDCGIKRIFFRRHPRSCMSCSLTFSSLLSSYSLEFLLQPQGTTAIHETLYWFDASGLFPRQLPLLGTPSPPPPQTPPADSYSAFETQFHHHPLCEANLFIPLPISRVLSPNPHPSSLGILQYLAPGTFCCMSSLLLSLAVSCWSEDTLLKTTALFI